jgi:crotonobetaine/carnitine-CoA ligase
MLDIDDRRTIGAVWDDAAATHRVRPFLVLPPNVTRGYSPAGAEITYGAADAEVRRLAEAFSSAGYGLGHRVALLLENRPDHFLVKLALNRIGVSCVPINPDYRANETAYLIDHSEPVLVLALPERVAQIEAALAESARRPAITVVDGSQHLALPPSPRAPSRGAPEASTEASILYTSGTTGRPKGCMLSHGYEVSTGERYIRLDGPAAVREGTDRIYNPLPLYHLNAGVVSFFGAVLSGNCQIQPDRFHPERWWPEVVATRATIVHYLGVVIQMLMLRPNDGAENGHAVRFGFGAGVEPQLHAAFEARFGFPLVEVWGMTEFCRVLSTATSADRKVGTRAFGRAEPGLDVKVVDDRDQDVADGTPGEMVVRYSAATPRRGAFSGYLKNPQETEKGWRGGWWHTGDTVVRATDGMLHFVDRKKNIIRRSGENIAAAEIEALLLTHPDVAQAAVLAVKDETREEEVLACIQLKPAATAEWGAEGARKKAEALFGFCNERLAYYKAPGWIWFAESLPVTGTQKIQKHTIFPGIDDPRNMAGMQDLRALKRRR